MENTCTLHYRISISKYSRIHSILSSISLTGSSKSRLMNQHFYINRGVGLSPGQATGHPLI